MTVPMKCLRRNPHVPKSTAYRNNSSRKARAYLGKEMDSEESNFDLEAEEEETEESEGVARLALATALVSKLIFSTEESATQEIHEEYEETTPSFCFMAKSSKVPSQSSCDDASD